MSQYFSTCPTVLVTGATDGIGYATARQFVDDGATVYLHAPDRDSGEQAMARLVKAGAEPLRLNLVVADFTCLDEVADLADTLTVALPKLDVLVNNAAVTGPERRTSTPDGHEIAFQVNYLAPYLLTTKLAPKLAGAHGRVVNVSSVMHRGGNISWNNLTRVHEYSPLAVYAQSKLALTMYTRSLAEVSGESLTAFSVHPGTFATRLLPLYGHSGRPVEEAATILTTLSSPAHPVVDGAYYDGLEHARPAALVANPRARIRLQKLTSRLLESVLN
ncbi:MAG: SDR family NAD(P)-dependent oxidoreductase [Mycobacterium sp.]|nr:SDR family NAD(P)-dependent oxidoreductase [Mycobacterium sp.]